MTSDKGIILKTHKDLERWKKSIALAVALSRLTKYFPKEELYGVTRQLKCSAVSIPLYIAKGTARNYKSEHIQYLYIALGSHSELDTQCLISKNFKKYDMLPVTCYPLLIN